MSLSIQLLVLLFCWGMFFLVWGIGWVYNLIKGPASQTRKGISIDYLWIIGAATVFLLNRFVVRVLSPDFAIHLPLWVEMVGGVCLVASTGLALWSRFALGTMWSSYPTLKTGHQLRTDGPYRISRHPIYTGMIGMLVGSALITSGNGLVILFALLTIIRLLLRIPVEEKLMIETFGEQYLAYQQQVPQLIPGTQWLTRTK